LTEYLMAVSVVSSQSQ